jgi:hypothetical protein
MAGEETTNKGNIISHINAAQTGLNMDNSLGQVPRGKLTYALNANVENFDSNSVNYQNEEGNELCLNFPSGYQIIGNHFIAEKNKHIFFLVNGLTGGSEIGYMINNDCQYLTFLNLPCLNFKLNYPIQKVVHKITNCTTEIYWTDGLNPRRYLDLDKEPVTDCNRLKIQPNFTIPQLTISDVVIGGELTSGTYQFAIQYSDANGTPYTSYYSITNPLPIGNTNVETLDFSYPVNRSIVVNITNIDETGVFEYYNLAVIKTVNAIESVELIGTYSINSSTVQPDGSLTNKITYTGQNQTQIRLAIEDIFEKFPYYDVAEDITSVQDVLVWNQLTSNKRVAYQKIANDISLQWESYRIPPTENYANELNATKLRGYLRDEVYALEIVFLLKNGKQTDGFHIPGRAFINGVDGGTPQTTIPSSNADYIGTGATSPYWKIYNTGKVLGTSSGYSSADSYKGPYQYGRFSYWESEALYPNNTYVWGSLANTPIRHHKFPDILVSPAFQSSVPTIVDDKYSVSMQSSKAVYPIGIRIDVAQVQALIAQAVIDEDITQEEADDIAGFKIVRGNRNTNKSIVAKGMLRNVGKYTRGQVTGDPTSGTTYYFPNYPYNDLNKDKFLLEKNNAYNTQCLSYGATVTTAGNIQVMSCNTGQIETIRVETGFQVINSLTTPTPLSGTAGAVMTVSPPSTDFYSVQNTYIIVSRGVTSFQYVLNGYQPYVFLNLTVEPNTTTLIGAWAPPTYIAGDKDFTVTLATNINYRAYPNNLDAFATNESKYRQVFNSPETSFGSPTLGSVLKLENVMYGAGKAHFVQVKNNSAYKFITKEAQYQALLVSYELGNKLSPFDATAMFTTYQAYLTIYITGITRKNFSYSYNSVANYDYSSTIANDLGIKQRQLDLYQYLSPGVQSVGDIYDINNYQRENSVYLKTSSSKTSLPFPNATPSLNGRISDFSRFTAASQSVCGSPEKQIDINVVSYYASIKNINPVQWGQIYTYETIDTGFQIIFDELVPGQSKRFIVFGGDTFICRFGFKTKLPFFIDNRVGAADDADVLYDQLGNVAYPAYWHSSRSIFYNFNKPDSGSPLPQLNNIISIKATMLDCSGSPAIGPYAGFTSSTTTTKLGGTSQAPIVEGVNGKMYQFAYGIPYFYCESSINVDLRQAFNNREGNFYPRVSSGIPDEWFQQINVPINFDNTYYYNVTYSKQNTDNFFSHLPTDWSDDQCYTFYPYRAIYSDSQSFDPTNEVNSWLTYRATSFFDFPQNFGNLVSLDGIQNKAVLARFENKSLLYNTMLTINTSNPQAAYVGNDTLFKSAPPVDFAETDLGYVGSQHKFLLKIPQGQVTIDAKRGRIFLISGNGAEELSGFGSGVNRFMINNLAFKILKYFPNADIDNAFSKVGVTGVYDSKYSRIIISKLDYVPQSAWVGKIFYQDDETSPIYGEYYRYPIQNNTEVKEVVQLTNLTYFCNKSWTLSFNMNTKSWVSFHSYIPNYYIAENNFFYSGLNSSCDLTAIAAIEVTTTTTTSTTLAPGNQEWYEISSCDDQSTKKTIVYPLGTFEIDDRVTLVDESVYTVITVYSTNPGGTQVAIIATGETGCPDLPATCNLAGTAVQNF